MRIESICGDPFASIEARMALRNAVYGTAAQHNSCRLAGLEALHPSAPHLRLANGQTTTDAPSTIRSRRCSSSKQQ